jgi:predicted outer membrane repeat protein
LRLNSLAGCAVVFFALAIPASPATLIITNTNDSGPGSLRDTLEIANDGDTITFAVTGSIVLTSGELLVDKSIIITAPGASNLAVDGNATSRVFYVAPGRTVSITGLTVANGTVSGDPLNSKGGGIYNDQATLTLNSCTVTGNLAGYGGGIYSDSLYDTAVLEISNSVIYNNSANYTAGGIYNDGGAGSAWLTISDTALTSNSAPSGGGIFNISGDFSAYAVLTVNNSTFSGNSADSGGCIYNDSYLGSASLTLNESTFSDNSAYDAGGCIYNQMVFGVGMQTVNNSTLSGNSAKNGGAIYNDQGLYLTINNCTISGNSAQKSGGGVYNDGVQGAGWLTIDSSTLDANSATAGGAIFNDGQQRGGTLLQISNSTFSENTARYGDGLASSGYDARYVRVNISNSTFSDNSATDIGGGIYSTGRQGRDTVLVTLINTIFKSGPLGDNIFSNSATISSLGYNLANDDFGGFLIGPGDLPNTDPMLGPLQDNGGPTLTHALLPGSPAIDAGDPNFTPPPLYDQRGPGFDRVVNDRVDIGSFEVQEPALASRRRRNPISKLRLTLLMR